MIKSNNMKRNLLIIAHILVGSIFALPAYASHIIGAEIRYKCLGSNQYKIILDVYRDCFYGIPPLDAPARVAMYKADGTFVNVLNMGLMSQEIIPNNISGDPCLFPPSDVCVQHGHYEQNTTIPATGGIYFVYQRCCRNETISNIINPAQTGSSYYVYLTPEARQLCNDSPEFNFYPPVFVCVNTPIHHPHAAVDADGDSLVYEFYTPFQGASFDEPQPVQASPPPYTEVTWAPNYGLNALLGITDPLTINHFTGLITGTPHISGQFVVGVQVKEYRNNQLLSIVRRDFQYNVGQCAELNVQIEAPAAQCDDLSVEFGNNTQVAQDFQWYYKKNNNPNFVLFSTVDEPTFTFPGVGTYLIMLIAEPVGACRDTGFHTLLLQNNSLTPDFSWQTFDCTNESVLVIQDESVDNVSPPVQWNWKVQYGSTTLTSTLQNPVFEIPNPSSGTIMLTVRSLNGCEQSKTVSFQSGNNDPTDGLPTTVQACIGNSVQLNPNGAVPGFTYKWAPPVPINQQNSANPSVTPLQTTIYNVTITGFNGLCVSVAQVTAQVSPAVQLAFLADTDCDAKVVHFINQSQNVQNGYVWNFGDPATTADVSTQANPTYVYPAFGTYTVTLRTTANAVCKDTIQQTITLAEKILEPAFTYKFLDCEEDDITIRFFDQTDNSEANTASWLWTFSGVYNGTATTKNPVIHVSQQGTLNVTLQVTTDENCVATLPVPGVLQIDLTELPGLDADGGEVLGCLNGGVTLNPNGNPNYDYLWTPATGLSCTTCPSPFANPSQTTTYTVRVTNYSADTCDIIREVTVLVPDNVGLVASNDVTTCAATATLTATTGLLPVTYAWFDETGGQVAGNVNTLTVNVSGYDSYVVRAIDQAGCPYYDTVQVVGGPANIQAVGDQIKCSDEVLNVSATNQDPNDTLTWNWLPSGAFNGPVNVPNPDIISTPGEQFVQVLAVNQFGCGAQDSVYVAVINSNNQLDFDYEVDCNGSTVNFINQSTNAFNYSWNFGDPNVTTDISYEDNPSYSYPGPGTYQVRLTLDFDLACVDTIVTPVVITQTQFAVDFDFNYINCSEESIEVQFNDGTDIFQAGLAVTCWNWTTSDGQTSTLPNPVFTVNQDEDFSVTLSICTSNGCTGAITKTLNLDFIEVALEDMLVLCEGASAPLNPNGDTSYDYHWSPTTGLSNPDSPNPTVSVTQTTTYTVEITNFAQDTCSITKQITVFVPEKIDVSASGDVLTCGEAVTLTGSSNIQNTVFQWIATPGGIVGNNPVLTIVPPVDTQYKLIGADQYGCRDSAVVNVVNEAVAISWPQATTACPENEVQLTVLNANPDQLLGYVWTATPPGQVLPPANSATETIVTPPADQTATYTVTATNQFGCTQTLSQTITSFNFVAGITDSIKVCAGVPTELNPNGNPDLNYSWSPPTGLSNPNIANPTVTLNQTATYTTTVTDNFGSAECQFVVEVLVFVPPVIEIAETVDTFTCGDAITISAQANVPVNYQWLDEQGQVLGNNPILQVNPETISTYTVVATDQYQCSASELVVVANNQLDIVLDGNNGVIDTCPQPFYNLCITNLDPNDVLTFQWIASSGGSILDGGSTACPTVTSQQGVVSTFTANVSNQYGCSATENFSVNTFNFNPIIRENVSVCPNTATPLNPEAEGSTLHYHWFPETGLDNPNIPNPTVTANVDMLYQVSIQGFNDGDTCSFLQTVQVKVPPAIGLTTTPVDSSLCQSDDVTLSAFVNSAFVESYVWSENPDFSNPISTSNQVIVTPLGAEVYYVLATDTLGCTDTAQVTVNAFPINISLDDRYNFCVEKAPLTITVNNNDPAQTLTFEWEPDEYIQEVMMDGSIIVVDIPDTTVFITQVENQYGCKLTDSTTVYYFDIELTVNDSIFSTRDTILIGSGQSAQLVVTQVDGYTYEWTPATGLNNASIYNPVATPEETTTYTVLITDDGGCATTRQITIYVDNPDCDEENIFIPSAFTPNGDGENDQLFVRSDILDELDFAIYNRWGQKVFETNDKNTGWDGSFKNERLGPDVYGYYIKALCYNGQTFFKKGNVTLLR